MAKQTHKLNPKTVETLTAPGRYSDGDGLYLKVSRAEYRSWVLMYRWRGRWTDRGLGGPDSGVSLAGARRRAKAARRQLDAGIKPGSPAGTEPGTAPTFGAIADAVIEAKAGGWTAGHHSRWVYALSRRRDVDDKIEKAGFCLSIINRPV